MSPWPRLRQHDDDHPALRSPFAPFGPFPRFINTLPFLLPFLPLSSFAFFLFSFLAALSSPLLSGRRRSELRKPGEE